MRVNERIHTFYGLNNLLDPASAEYGEGMAFECNNARISNKGMWSSGLVSATADGITPIALSGGSGRRQMTINNTSALISAIGVAAESQNGHIYFMDGTTLKRYIATSAAAVALADVTNPAYGTAPAAGAVSSVSRMQDGYYYYIIVAYNNTIKREGLAAVSREVLLDSVANTTHNGVTLTIETNDLPVRIYRSKRTNAADNVSNAPNRFYFVDEVPAATTTYVDIRNDDELLVEYEGRGSVLLSPNFITAYNDRMLYIKSNDLWWSSSGRPEEVAQKWQITFHDGSNNKAVWTYPKLANGYGEAKKTIPELAGQTVTGAMEKDGKLWLFTNAMIGYLSESYGEGYIFKVWRRGVGVLNQFCLQSCEHGIFGFDGQGMWLMNNAGTIKRLTENRVDLSAWYSAGSSYHGVWCPDLSEYLMCNGATAIGYQPDKNIFCGPYGITSTSGCSWYGAAGAFGLSGENKVTVYSGATDFTLKFYLGQTSPTTIKQRITVEAVSNAANGITSIAIGAGAAKAAITADTPQAIVATDFAVRQTTAQIGRMILATIIVNGGVGSLTTLNYRYDPIEWSEEYGR